MDNIYAESHEALVVGLARNGDRKAFEDLVRRRESWLRGLMFRSCGDHAMADDLSQQAFLQAWRKLPHLKTPQSFGTWLKRLAINEHLQRLRKRDVMLDAEDWEPLALGHSDNPGLAKDLDAALGALPAAPRLCLVLAYQEQMSHSEIAGVTGIPLGTVKSHVRRGAETLRQLLADYAPGETRDE